MRIRPLLLLILSATVLGACATPPRDNPAARTAAELRAGTRPLPVAVEGEDLPPLAEDRIAPTLVKGSDLMIGKPSARGAVSVSGKGVSLHFEAAPITEVVHAVLGDLLKLDYAIVSPLSGEITVHTQAPVPPDQALGILDTLLQANGIVMVPDAAGRYQVGSAEALRGTVPIPRRTTGLASGFGSVVVPLQFIGAAEMAEILRPVAPDQALMRVDNVRNLLMLAGSRSQLEGWLEIINTFDVDFLKGMSVGLFPLTYAPVKEVDLALRALFSSGSGFDSGAAGAGAGGAAAAAPNAASPGGAPRAAISRGAAGAAGTGIPLPLPLTSVVRVMAIERLNALLIITPRAHYLEQARIWIERFDRPSDAETEGQLYVYPVRNGSAGHLASLLQALYGRGGGSQGARDSGVAPALSGGFGSQGFGGGSFGGGSFGGFGGSSFGGSTGSASGFGGFGGSSGSGFGGSAGFSGAGANLGGTRGQGAAVNQVDLGDDIRVVADEHNNALLIHASRREYRRIEAALRQLDISPVQVLIEASILEVTLRDELRYGLQWYFNDRVRDGRSGIGQLTSTASGVLAPTNPGFSYSLVDGAGSVRAVLNALADKSLLNVISTPSVMVQDNHTAAILVGDQQPIRSATTVTDGGRETTSIQYKDTGVALAVTPSVNSGDMVTMMVNQSVTDVGPIDEATKQRSFLQRQISSRVAVRSGETIVLGGLIRDNATRGRQGIPILHDIPVVGHLFGSTSIDNNRTELLVMITPRVVRSESDVREVSAELRERMRGLDSLRGRNEAELLQQNNEIDLSPEVEVLPLVPQSGS